jgi:pyruvate/2-oxoglutarate dehydrogenase complex dihydrolipoamide dehydrogenase (E3) component
MADFDLAVVGAGAAGLSVAGVAAQLGLRVALIERGRMGGDSLNFGCVPSKALLAAPAADWNAVRAHVHGVIAAIASMDSAERYTALGATVLRGEARFVAPDTLQVNGPHINDRRITARRIVIAAGSRAARPDLPGLADVPQPTHTDLFDLPERPAHLLILGGGPVGLEMAQAFCRLGSRVTLVESNRIAGGEDPELADGLRRTLRGQGVAILEACTVAAVEPGPTLVLADGARVTGSHLLIDAGRVPNIEQLGLEAGIVRAGPNGIATDAGLRSLTNRRVYAVGDIADPAGIGPRAFTHVGGHQAGIVIRRALFRLPARVDYAALPRVIYTSPELAQVGLTEAEARAAGHDVRVLRWPLSENDRAQAERRPFGLAKLVVTKRGRILGCGLLADHAGEMIGTWTLAIDRHIPLAALAGMIVPYPTLAEAPKRAAGMFFAPKLFADSTKRLVRWLAWLP